MRVFIAAIIVLVCGCHTLDAQHISMDKEGVWLLIAISLLLWKHVSK